MSSLSGLLKRCETETGYIEKASNSNLSSKTGNKGTANYTKYSNDINSLGLNGCQGQPWCATYQFWQEVQEFGIDNALKHWNMTKSTYVGYNCFSTYNRFNAVGKVSKTPKLGALVVFKYSHMGRVVKISGNTFWTNEGNTSAKAYDRNGGMVAEKSYSVNDKNIKGFCIIDYDEGIVSSTTSSTSTRSYLMKGDKGSEVKAMQENLIKLGYSCGSSGADGDFGDATDKAVRAFQKANGLTVDGKYGNSSKAKVNALLTAKSTTTTTTTVTSSKIDTIKKVQNWANTNYKSGIVADGIYGANTKKALVKILQTELNKIYGYKLSTDGIWGNKTKEACRTMSRGSKNNIVKVLQALLICNKISNVYVDGDYGSVTVIAVQTYQRKNGLTADGIAGKNTFAKLCS